MSVAAFQQNLIYKNRLWGQAWPQSRLASGLAEGNRVLSLVLCTETAVLQELTGDIGTSLSATDCWRDCGTGCLSPSGLRGPISKMKWLGSQEAQIRFEDLGPTKENLFLKWPVLFLLPPFLGNKLQDKDSLYFFSPLCP